MKRKKTVWWFVGILVIVLFIINVGKNSLVEYALKSQVKQASGMEVTIDRVDVGLIGANVRLEGLSIVNTPEFGGADFLRIPLLFLGSDLCSLFGSPKKINEIKLHVAHVGIVKNSAGELNLSQLKAGEEKDGRKDADFSRAEKKAVIVEILNLTFDHITFYDFSKGEKPEEIIIPIGLSHQTFKNVTSPQPVGQPLVMAAILEGTSEEGGMERIFAVGDNLKSIGGPQMEEKLNEFKKMFK